MFYVNVNNGEVKKVIGFENLSKLVKAGFYITKSYLDAVIYSRAVTLRGTGDNYGKKAVYFTNNY